MNKDDKIWKWIEDGSIDKITIANLLEHKEKLTDDKLFILQNYLIN